MSDALKVLLADLRQHPAFPELIAAVQKPMLPRFRASQAEEVEKARALWIYESGKTQQHEAWLALLTGRVPQNGE